jgi:hypothetical protein
VSAEVAERALRRLWPAGLTEIPPSAVPYLVHPWVVAVDRLRAAGWTPRHSNEETVLACLDRRRSPARLPLAAAGVTALAVGAGLAARATRRRGR